MTYSLFHLSIIFQTSKTLSMILIILLSLIIILFIINNLKELILLMEQIHLL